VITPLLSPRALPSLVLSTSHANATQVRQRTDWLDAAGNVTKAITKGYSIGSAAMACFVLFGAFMDEFSEYSRMSFTTVDIGTPEVLVGGLLGTAHIFYITGLSIAAVAKTAQEVVKEVSCSVSLSFLIVSSRFLL